MADLPEATLQIDESAGAPATSTGYVVVVSCVAQSADWTPRVFASTSDLLAQYLYAPGIDYCAMHFEETRKPVIFVGVPVATSGAISRVDQSGNTGTSQVTATAASSGIMEETHTIVEVASGGTVGTDQIALFVSCDNNESQKKILVGQGTSYTIPNLGIVINLGAGTLVTGDKVLEFRTSAPMWGSTDMATVRANLAAQQLGARSWVICGDLPNSTFAGYVTTEVNGYETANQRFTVARCSVFDLHPIPNKSKIKVAMTAVTALAFDGTGHTITRTGGSFLTDGFVNGDVVTVHGTVSNDGVYTLTGLSATVMTFASGLTTETAPLSTSILGSEGLTFAASGHTVTRTSGSWIADGFAVGDSVTFSGTTSNNFTATISALSATVMTFASGVTNEGPLESYNVTCLKNYTTAAWKTATAAAFATVDAQKRIDLSEGRGTKASPINGWLLRRPASWAASLRENQHDLQVPCWRKADGPCDGWEITDANDNKVEFDDLIDGGGVTNRFTCFRSYSNGPSGAFIALSLTRDTEGLPLSRTHNLMVANLACTVVQVTTEDAIGQVLVLNDDGTVTEASATVIEERVNSALQRNLLQNFNEGPRASKAKWTASRTDVLSAPGSTWNGTLALNLNGTVEKIATRVAVNAGA